jgi:hypothetical protein
MPSASLILLTTLGGGGVIPPAASYPLPVFRARGMRGVAWLVSALTALLGSAERG